MTPYRVVSSYKRLGGNFYEPNGVISTPKMEAAISPAFLLATYHIEWSHVTPQTTSLPPPESRGAKS
jgi:hypothetical protein